MNESLGLAIRHHTGFTYDGLAKASYNEARMTPITGASQEVRNAHVAVQPVVPLSTHTDYFGTIVSACADGILPVCNNCRKFKPSTNSISR